ncbi:MAG: hypothetical protein KKB03_04215 [Nanoarchaeota archaeon]|nr:hypothetical protein [Nanoarchaeota archaeon]MBU1135400.1 hypothetical protein [Nanoarchaeota archaeon]MBU2520418.1 hypothetical protein [Nanoarchaeota archaeon]
MKTIGTVWFLILILFKYTLIGIGIYVAMFVFGAGLNLFLGLFGVGASMEEIVEGFNFWFSWEGVKRFLVFIVFVCILIGGGSSISQDPGADNTGGC